MNYIRQLRGFFEHLEEDANMTSQHISLYMALFNLWNLNRFREQFEINRLDVMAMARIGSKSTYSKCMKELNDWGYIRYSPGANRYQVSKVSCTRFGTASGTATGTASGTATGTTSGTASGSPFINYMNKRNSKEESSQNLKKNGRKKQNGKSNPLHVETDKDYSEPL
ncbi:hypothetical protein [Draconibacterium halophilum]|uniref:Uncharacterized protein n=1 Tax=Draconibacterium halophilum TaxID=2706887 RepID=A0A6C0RGE7_9BACT|nr:hypothetical protein [Draconibacterium halophilum]QIA09137.1 hypothetical protein G0Q07_16055 [Draconibacterium halophilum]